MQASRRQACSGFLPRVLKRCSVASELWVNGARFGGGSAGHHWDEWHLTLQTTAQAGRQHRQHSSLGFLQGFGVEHGAEPLSAKDGAGFELLVPAPATCAPHRSTRP